MSFYPFSGCKNVSINAKGSSRDTGSWHSCPICSSPVLMSPNFVRQDSLFVGVKVINTNT